MMTAGKAVRKALAIAVLLNVLGLAPTIGARAETLTVLTHPLPPFTIGSEGAPEGLAVDIVQAIMARTGDTGIWRVEPFPRLLRDVQAGPETAGFIVARTPEREALMQWVGPLAVNGVYLYKKAGSPVTVNTLDDARHLAALGVTRGDADHTFLRSLGFTNLQISDSQELDLRKVLLGRVDATPMGELVFPRAVADLGLSPRNFARTGLKLYESAVYVAFSPDVPRPVIDAWTTALSDMKTSGEHAALLSQYGIQ